MKRTMFGLLALAVSFGLATSTMAQIQNQHKYSSYGYQPQEGSAQDASPSDVPLPPATAQDPAINVDSSVVGSAVIDSASSCEKGCGSGCGGGDLIQSNSRNVTFGLRGSIFTRDYEDNRLYGNNAFGDCLCSTDVRESTMGGMEVFLGVRNCSGFGWEFDYWGLYPNDATTVFGGSPFTTALTGLNDLDLVVPFVDVIFNSADYWQATRYNEMQSFELNMLRNAGTTRGFCSGCVNIEWLAGIRWFKFDEDIQLAAYNSTAGFPQQSIYDVGVDNNLLGFQFGARADRCLTDCLSLSLGVKWGIYNNQIDHNQSIRAGDGTFATIAVGPDAGTNYDFYASDNDVATMGELDLGLNWHFKPCWRASVGYRAVGLAGVALAPDQIPIDFADPYEVWDINSNGDLLMHGLYFGLEHAF